MDSEEIELTIQKFYREYNSWVKQGAKEHISFMRNGGLCDCLSSWLRDNNVPSLHRKQLDDYLTESFIAAGLHKHFPFGGSELYANEYKTNTTHLNTMRLNWVRKQINNNEVKSWKSVRAVWSSLKRYLVNRVSR